MSEVRQSCYPMTLFRSTSGEKCESSMMMEYTFSKMSEHSYDPSQCNNLQDYQPNKTHRRSLKTTYVVQTMCGTSVIFMYCIRCDEVG